MSKNCSIFYPRPWNTTTNVAKLFDVYIDFLPSKCQFNSFWRSLFQPPSATNPWTLTLCFTLNFQRLFNFWTKLIKFDFWWSQFIWLPFLCTVHYVHMVCFEICFKSMASCFNRFSKLHLHSFWSNPWQRGSNYLLLTLYYKHKYCTYLIVQYI